MQCSHVRTENPKSYFLWDYDNRFLNRIQCAWLECGDYNTLCDKSNCSLWKWQSHLQSSLSAWNLPSIATLLWVFWRRTSPEKEKFQERLTEGRSCRTRISTISFFHWDTLNYSRKVNKSKSLSVTRTTRSKIIDVIIYFLYEDKTRKSFSNRLRSESERHRRRWTSLRAPSAIKRMDCICCHSGDIVISYNSKNIDFFLISVVATFRSAKTKRRNIHWQTFATLRNHFRTGQTSPPKVRLLLYEGGKSRLFFFFFFFYLKKKKQNILIIKRQSPECGLETVVSFGSPGSLWLQLHSFGLHSHLQPNLKRRH